MSKLIDTEFGQFRQVDDGGRKWFLLECRDCGEMLPLTEDILAGNYPVDHESRTRPSTICSFNGCHPLGTALISKMQSLILMGYQAHHDENENEWQEIGAGRGTDREGARRFKN